jgi:hypothetical protein
MRTELTELNISKFWKMVDKQGEDDCWNWLGMTDRYGYGKFNVTRNRKSITIRAHRASFELNKGIDPKDMLVCHTCDHPLCVNPKHLFLGTWSSNMTDKAIKGRGNASHGENNPAAKLTTENVIAIKAMRGRGETLRSIAEAFGITDAHVHRIASGKRWNKVGNGKRGGK